MKPNKYEQFHHKKEILNKGDNSLWWLPIAPPSLLACFQTNSQKQMNIKH